MLFLLVMLILKVIKLFQLWIGQKFTFTAFIQQVPVFVIFLPILLFLVRLSQGAEDLADFYISTEAYRYLIVYMAPWVSAFIIMWSMFYSLYAVIISKWGRGG